MHEASVVGDLIRKAEAVVRDAGAERAECVYVELGSLAHLSPDHLRQHFSTLAAGTLLDGSRLDVRIADDTTAPGALDLRLVGLDVTGTS